METELEYILLFEMIFADKFRQVYFQGFYIDL